jgi:hypothetical protein
MKDRDRERNNVVNPLDTISFRLLKTPNTERNFKICNKCLNIYYRTTENVN